MASDSSNNENSSVGSGKERKNSPPQSSVADAFREAVARSESNRGGEGDGSTRETASADNRGTGGSTRSETAREPASGDAASSEPTVWRTQETERAEQASRADAAADPDEDDRELERVREILLGRHERRVGERLDALEARMERQFQSLQEDVQRQLQAIREAQEERNELADTLEAQKQTHREELGELERTLYQGMQALKSDLSEARSTMDDRLDATEREVERHLREQEDRISDMIADHESDLEERLDTVACRIRRTANRDDLAELFMDLAERLRD